VNISTRFQMSKAIRPSKPKRNRPCFPAAITQDIICQPSGWCSRLRDLQWRQVFHRRAPTFWHFPSYHGGLLSDQRPRMELCFRAFVYPSNSNQGDTQHQISRRDHSQTTNMTDWYIETNERLFFPSLFQTHRAILATRRLVSKVQIAR
jgi:hypothetical protein